MPRKGSSFLSIANIIAFTATVIINALAGSTNLVGGRNTAQVSNTYPTLVTPAGYVFSIWGVIYLLLALFVVYQALPSQRRKEFPGRISWLFVLSCIVNIAWLFFWQTELLPISVVLMFLLLASLTAIYVRLGIGKLKVGLKEKMAVHVPFSVYLGWITIAAIANVAATLVAAGWDGFGLSPEVWVIAVLVLALALTFTVLTVRKDVAYSLVIIWALVGIGVNHVSNQTVFYLTELSAIIVAVYATTQAALTVQKRK